MHTFSKSSLITLDFARIKIQNSTIKGNYADLSANIISMIYSTAEINESYLSNQQNTIGVSSKIMNNVESGMVNMNYQSSLSIANSTIDSFTGQQTGIINSSG